MLGRIALCATLAGVLAALLLTLAQSLWITPLILQAEVYEAIQAESSSHEHNAIAFSESSREAMPLPADADWRRSLSTAVSNSLLGIGYALILVGFYTLRRPLGVTQGLAWGLAGYVVFFAAPGLGLPPELPGTATADLASRQYWWLGTALATAIGFGLLFLQPRWLLRMAGVLLLIVPHMIGAPQPPMLESLAPAALQTQFRLATLVSNALFWLALGAISAGCYRRWCLSADQSGYR